MRFNREKFFEGFRERIDPTIEQEQVDGLEFLLGKMEADPFWLHVPQIAYALATVFHETAGSFQPVGEGYYLGSPAKVKAFQKKLRYYPYFGRGYVQLTWKRNYQKADREIGSNMTANPDEALSAENSYLTMTYGMHHGWFTGKKLDDYIKGNEKDYVNARRIINGTDKAGLIAGYATSFEKILRGSEQTSSTEIPDSGDKGTEITAKESTVGEKTLEVTAKNEQDVNAAAKVEGPKPYNEIGLKDTLKNDAKTVVPANFGLQSISEYAQQASGWPEWVIALIGKVALFLLVLTFGWVVYRLISYLVHNWRENERVKLQALIDSDINRKNLTLK